jgi:hypothetical protein
MTELKEMLRREDVRGVVRSASGRLREFRRQGVIDLFQLLSDEPAFLQGASMADRVVGRGAALLMVKGGVKEVFAFVLSQPALDVLRQAGITISYDTLQPNIINRTGTDICPVEKLTVDTTDADEAFRLIGNFLNGTKS